MIPALWHAWRRIMSPHLLVVGDVILDRYTWGNAERISPEAPVPVLRIDSHEARLGGAASVAALLRGLGAQVTLAGVVGDDPEGRTVQKILRDSQIDSGPVLVDVDRPTTWKERFIGRAAGRHPHQMLRVDREIHAPLTPTVTAQLLEHIVPLLGQFHGVLISDYGKGVCTPEILKHLIVAGRAKQLSVIADPARGVGWNRYRGVTLLKPNRIEAEEASGLTIQSPEDALIASHALCKQLEIPAVLITLDRDGMALSTEDGVSQVFGTKARAVYDITGAGDMVLAILGMGIASGLSLVETLPLANAAAGLEVERSGVTSITRQELARELCSERAGIQSKIVALDELTALVAAYRESDKSIVLTNGCFDLLHRGHLAVLEEATNHGDILIVAVNSDASVRSLKGPSRPIIPENDRAAMLAGLANVDHVVIFDESTPHRLLERLKPDVLVKGGSYSPKEVVGWEIVEAYGGRVVITALQPDISTTRIVASINQQSC